MFRKNKPTIKILNTEKADTGKSQNGERVASPPVPPLIKIEGKERLPMDSPEQAIAQKGKDLLPKRGGKARPGITVEIGASKADGSLNVTAWSQFSVKPAQAPFVPPFSGQYLENVIQELRGSVQHSSKGSLAVRGDPAEAKHGEGVFSIESFGKKIFDTLFKDALLEMYVEAVENATAQFPISIMCGEPASRIPWEFMHDGQRFVCTDVGPIFRIPPSMFNALPEALPQNLRLLVVATNPVGTSAIGWLQEVRTIKELVQHSKIEMKVIHSMQEFQHELLEWRPHIIHVIAHGEANELQIGNEGGDSIRVGRVLNGLMAALPEVPRLILFNACDSGGLAAELVRGRIPLAVGMQFVISDPAAQAFARGFYEYARTGLPLHKATAWGRLTIQMDLGGNSREWATPILYVNPKTVDLS
ncbi:MAG TPA: CHAT domain-containing protein [Candidatus Angelobacter sp.]|jgi:hypothetical protein|nr:CHAT domain-containing protein [Candidatus Angelobacter sp.]